MNKHLSKSFEVLSHVREMGVGATVTTTMVRKRAPWLSTGAISGALSSFCAEGRLELLGIDDSITRGRKPNLYKVLPEINEDRTFHKEPVDYNRTRKAKDHSDTKPKVQRGIPVKRSADNADQILSLVSDMQDTIVSLQQENTELKKNPDLTTLDESLLWQEIIRRRESEGRALSPKGKKRAKKALKQMTVDAVAQGA